MRKSKLLVVGLTMSLAIGGVSGCGKVNSNYASPSDLPVEESLEEGIDKIVYDGVNESKAPKKLTDKESEEAESIEAEERESIASEMESLSDILNERTGRNHTEANSNEIGTNERNGESSIDKNTDTTIAETTQEETQPDYSNDEAVKEADSSLNKPDDVLTVTDTVEFEVGGTEEDNKEQVAKVGDVWVYISPSVIKGGYAVLNNGDQCRIAIGTAENYQSYCDIYQLHKGEFDRDLINDKFVAQKIRDIYGLAKGKLETEARDEGDTYLSKIYSYNYTDAAALYWCKKGVYLFRWHSDIGGNYLYPMNNILPDYSYNNSGSTLN